MKLLVVVASALGVFLAIFLARKRQNMRGLIMGVVMGVFWTFVSLIMGMAEKNFPRYSCYLLASNEFFSRPLSLEEVSLIALVGFALLVLLGASQEID